MSGAAAIGPRISGFARRLPTWPFYILGALPPIWLVYAGSIGSLGVDPVKAIEHQLGIWSLQLLLASLCITPLLRFAKINLVKFRKVLGLLAFAYIVLHFLVWLLLDLQLRWGEIGADIVKRPYITVGFAALVLLVPLAATSFQRAMKALGPQGWARLHRLVYVAVLLGAWHFVMQEKVWTAESLAYLAAAIILVGMRLIWIRRW